KPFSFPVEGGAHGGPGFEETEGFVLTPSDISVLGAENFVRPLDLRRAALKFLKREGTEVKITAFKDRFKEDRILRVMTYNVHSCRGMDGKVSPVRISRII